jgi:hypothetical protein
MLKTFSGKRLLKIAAIKSEKERRNEIERLLQDIDFLAPLAPL